MGDSVLRSRESLESFTERRRSLPPATPRAPPAPFDGIDERMTGSPSTYYRGSGDGPQKMGWGHRSALLIVDVCRAYWSEASPLSLLSNPDAANVPDSIGRLLDAARSGVVPIIWTAVRYDRNGDMKDAGLFYTKCSSLDLWKEGDTRDWAEWMPELVPSDGEEVVYKKYASGFFETTLKESLKIKNVDTVIVCGVSTSGCVRATALDAMQNGFRPMVNSQTLVLR